MAIITINRSLQYAAGGKSFEIVLNNKTVGSINGGESKSFEVSAGRNEIQLKLNSYKSEPIYFDFEKSDDKIIFFASSPFWRTKYKPYLAHVKILLLLASIILNHYLHNENIIIWTSLIVILWIVLEFFFDKENSIFWYLFNKNKFIELKKVD